MIDHFEQARIPIIAITGNAGSMLAEAASAALVLPHWAEVGPESVAPTTSTTMTLALGDALAMTVMRQKGFTRTDFGRLHPGGSLGARLKPVKRLMHSGEAVPLTGHDSSMHDTLVEMSAKRLGVIGVTDDAGHLVGVITDGDLRRNIERGLDHSAGEFMTRDPKTIAPDALIDDALALFDEYRITALFVVERRRREKPVGVLHIHDCPASRDERGDPDPGALSIDALSGKAAGRTKGASGAAKPLIQRSVEAARRVPGSAACSSSPTTSGSPTPAPRFGVGVIMTSPECRNGTERCAEALAQLHDPDLVINFQGDALLTPPGFRRGADRAHGGRSAMRWSRPRRCAYGATKCARFRPRRRRAGRRNERRHRRRRLCALFLQAADPAFARARWTREMSPVRLHVGVYAYRPEALERYVATPVSELETLEGLEQLRFLAAGVPVAVVDVETPPFALRELNNPEDVAPIEQALIEAGLE